MEIQRMERYQNSAITFCNFVAFQNSVVLNLSVVKANKANQPDPFFVRCAHKKGSGYLRRYTSQLSYGE
jgi:hypothetical protein